MFFFLWLRKALGEKRSKEPRATLWSSPFKSLKGHLCSMCLLRLFLCLTLWTYSTLFSCYGSSWLSRQPQHSQRIHSQDHITRLVSLPLRAWGLPWAWPITHSRRSGSAKEFIEVHMGDAWGEITSPTPPLCVCTCCLSSLSLHSPTLYRRGWGPHRDPFAFYKAYCYGNCV